MSVRNSLKRLIPWSVRRSRYAIRDQYAELAGPAPLKQFDSYNDYWGKRKEFKEPMRRWIMASEKIADRSTILDFGCGSGDFLKYLRSVKPNVTAKGVDVSAKAVEMTRERGFDAEVFDVLNQELPGTFDYVTSFEVLEHIGEADLALQKLKKAFRKQLIISVPNVGSINCRIRLAIFGRFPLTRCVMHIKEHLRHWTPKDFKDWAASQNLRVVEAHGDWGIPYTPWKKCPSLFARGMVYVLEHSDKH